MIKFTYDEVQQAIDDKDGAVLAEMMSYVLERGLRVIGPQNKKNEKTKLLDPLPRDHQP